MIHLKALILAILWFVVAMPICALLMVLEFTNKLGNIFITYSDRLGYKARRTIVDYFNTSFAKYNAQKSDNKK